MFIALLFVIPPTWTLLKYASSGECMYKQTVVSLFNGTPLSNKKECTFDRTVVTNLQIIISVKESNLKEYILFDSIYVNLTKCRLCDGNV